uniref:Uncharacterized protein n=1 Tax=Rhizophora mucronata TaxID=61149 RepID=A0A2P2QF57_RHIMU
MEKSKGDQTEEGQNITLHILTCNHKFHSNLIGTSSTSSPLKELIFSPFKYITQQQ